MTDHVFYNFMLPSAFDARLRELCTSSDRPRHEVITDAIAVGLDHPCEVNLEGPDQQLFSALVPPAINERIAAIADAEHARRDETVARLLAQGLVSLSAHLGQLPVAANGQALVFRYTNYRGETAIRRAGPPFNFYFGSTEYHPEPQWLLEATDLDKSAPRTFALKDTDFAAAAPTPADAQDKPLGEFRYDEDLHGPIIADCSADAVRDADRQVRIANKRRQAAPQPHLRVEYDASTGSYDIVWADGSFLTVFPSGRIIAGKSPAGDVKPRGFTVDELLDIYRGPPVDRAHVDLATHAIAETNARWTAGSNVKPEDIEARKTPLTRMQAERVIRSLSTAFNLELDTLFSRIAIATIASCSCLTKTHDPSYHDATCRYRVLSDARDLVQHAALTLYLNGRANRTFVEGERRDDADKCERITPIEALASVPRQPTTQRPLYDQLQEMKHLAEHFGLPDAAAWVDRLCSFSEAT